MRVLLIAIVALVAVSSSSAARPPSSTTVFHPPDWHLPKCYVQNPPISPVRRPDSEIVIAPIRNKCEQPVWQLGGWVCLQARKGRGNPWRNVWCEANQVYFKLGLTVWADVVGFPTTHPWEWRSQGHVWVIYDPGEEPYRSLTVTSAFVPIYLHPIFDQ